MRVLIAPDSFGDTLTAVAAADAIAAGWARARPGDEVVCAPLSDGGPGFVDVLATRFGRVVTTTVRGPLDQPVDARWLLDETATGVTAYIECAQACGLHQVGTPTPTTALAAATRGVGDLIVAARSSGATTIVIGLGGSGSTDGGAGLLEALAAASGAPHNLSQARTVTADVDLVAATDVDNPLLGPRGAAAVFGPQKGADAATVALLEERMTAHDAVLTAVGGRVVSGEPGAGAAGGLGAALLALGARRVSGASVIADAVGLESLVDAADVLVTGEGRFDEQTLQGKVIAAVADIARNRGVPTIVMAGQVRLGPDALRAAGIGSAHAVVDVADSVEHAMSEAGPLLARLAEGVAATRPM